MCIVIVVGLALGLGPPGFSQHPALVEPLYLCSPSPTTTVGPVIHLNHEGTNWSPSLTYSLLRIVVIPMSSSHNAASTVVVKHECIATGEAQGASILLKRRRPSGRTLLVAAKILLGGSSCCCLFPN